MSNIIIYDTYNVNVTIEDGEVIGVQVVEGFIHDVIAGSNISIDKSDPLNPVISSPVTLTNGSGTTANGTAVDLGGTLTGDAEILAGNNPFSITGNNGDGGTFYISMGAGSSLSIGQTQSAFTTDQILFTPGGAQIVVSSNSIGFQGLVYSSDFSADYTELSLVDKGYADTKMINPMNTVGDIISGGESGGPTRRGTVSAASTSSLTIDSDTTYQYSLTALAAALSIEAPTGTPFNGQDLLIRILDNGTARALTWNAIFRVIGVTLPTTTVISKTMYIACIYNSADTKWDVIGVREQA